MTLISKLYEVFKLNPQRFSLINGCLEGLLKMSRIQVSSWLFSKLIGQQFYVNISDYRKIKIQARESVCWITSIKCR